MANERLHQRAHLQPQPPFFSLSCLKGGLAVALWLGHGSWFALWFLEAGALVLLRFVLYIL
jgi:hypothetical protein